MKNTQAKKPIFFLFYEAPVFKMNLFSYSIKNLLDKEIYKHPTY